MVDSFIADVLNENEAIDVDLILDAVISATEEAMEDLVEISSSDEETTQ